MLDSDPTSVSDSYVGFSWWTGSSDGTGAALGRQFLRPANWGTATITRIALTAHDHFSINFLHESQRLAECLHLWHRGYLNSVSYSDGTITIAYAGKIAFDGSFAVQFDCRSDSGRRRIDHQDHLRRQHPNRCLRQCFGDGHRLQVTEDTDGTGQPSSCAMVSTPTTHLIFQPPAMDFGRGNDRSRPPTSYRRPWPPVIGRQ